MHYASMHMGRVLKSVVCLGSAQIFAFLEPMSCRGIKPGSLLASCLSSLDSRQVKSWVRFGYSIVTTRCSSR